MFYLHLVVFFITSLDKGVKMLVLKPVCATPKEEQVLFVTLPLGFGVGLGFLFVIKALSDGL